MPIGRTAHRWRPAVLLALAVLAVVCTAVFASSPTVGQSAPVRVARAACGIERWDVETLTDPAAGRVDFRPRPTTVRTLTRLKTPPFSFRRGPGASGRHTGSTFGWSRPARRPTRTTT